MFNKNELILLSAYALEGRGINPGTRRNSNIKMIKLFPTRITHVAVKTDEKLWMLPPPNRHHNVLHLIYRYGVKRNYETEEQGFADNTGKFLSREDAFVLAKTNGQLKRGTTGYQGDELFSEDL